MRQSYWRNFKGEKTEASQRFTILYDNEGQLLGIFLATKPAAFATEHLRAHPKTKHQLPWEGQWYEA